MSIWVNSFSSREGLLTDLRGYDVSLSSLRGGEFADWLSDCWPWKGCVWEGRGTVGYDSASRFCLRTIQTVNVRWP
jgi:hypothetical protein